MKKYPGILFSILFLYCNVTVADNFPSEGLYLDHDRVVSQGGVGNFVDRSAASESSQAPGMRPPNGPPVSLIYKLNHDDLFFDTGSDELSVKAKDDLAELGEYLANHPEQRVSIQGYTDTSGNDAANLRLSKQRASAVSEILREHGAKVSQIQAHGLGEAKMISRAQSRHVELDLTS